MQNLFCKKGSALQKNFKKGVVLQKFSSTFLKRWRSQGRGALVASAEAKLLLPYRIPKGTFGRPPLVGEI